MYVYVYMYAVEAKDLLVENVKDLCLWKISGRRGGVRIRSLHELFLRRGTALHSARLIGS